MSSMSRIQLALNVDDLDEAITFYSKLFNTAPAKVKPGVSGPAGERWEVYTVLADSDTFGARC